MFKSFIVFNSLNFIIGSQDVSSSLNKAPGWLRQRWVRGKFGRKVSLRFQAGYWQGSEGRFSPRFEMQGLAGLQFTKPTTLGNPNWRCQSSRETCTGTMHWSYKHCPTCCWRGSEGGAFHMLWRENLSPPKGLFASKEKKSADKWQILEICASTGRCNLNLRHSGLLLVSFPVLLQNFVLVSVTIKKSVFFSGAILTLDEWRYFLIKNVCQGPEKWKKCAPNAIFFESVDCQKILRNLCFCLIGFGTWRCELKKTHLFTVPFCVHVSPQIPLFLSCEQKNV